MYDRQLRLTTDEHNTLMTTQLLDGRPSADNNGLLVTTWWVVRRTRLRHCESSKNCSQLFPISWKVEAVVGDLGLKRLRLQTLRSDAKSVNTATSHVRAIRPDYERLQT